MVAYRQAFFFFITNKYFLFQLMNYRLNLVYQGYIRMERIS